MRDNDATSREKSRFIESIIAEWQRNNPSEDLEDHDMPLLVSRLLVEECTDIVPQIMPSDEDADESASSVIHWLYEKENPIVGIRGPAYTGKQRVVGIIAWRCLYADRVPQHLTGDIVRTLKPIVYSDPMSREAIAWRIWQNEYTFEMADRIIIHVRGGKLVEDLLRGPHLLATPIIVEEETEGNAGTMPASTTFISLCNEYNWDSVSVPIKPRRSIKDMADLIWDEAIHPNRKKYKKTYGWIPTRTVVREAARIESLTVDGSVEDYCPSRALAILHSAMDKWFTPGSGHLRFSVTDLNRMAIKAYDIPEINNPSAGLTLGGYDENNDDPPKLPRPSPASIPSRRPAHGSDKNENPNDHVDDRVQNILSQLSSSKKSAGKNAVTELEKESKDVTKFMFTDRADLLDQLEKRIIGQNEALKRVVRPIMMRRAGIRDHDKPIAGLLLAGPSGVGKTETALALASVVYGSEDSLIRIDCSSMKNGEMSVSSLLGSGNGYVGSNQGGRHTNWVRDHGAGVIVFDEIEKASPEIWDAVLLPMLDYGKITDASKGTRDCSDCIIILTSNIGTGSIGRNGMKSVGFGGSGSSIDDEMKILENDVKNAVEKTFRPELVGRLTDVIVYRPLTNEDYEKIFTIQWRNRAEQLNALNVHVDVDDSVPKWLASHCREDNHGVRILGKMINDRIIDPLTDMIVGGKEPLDIIVSISPDDEISIENAPEF